MEVDLRWVAALCYRNGIIEESGVAAAVLNHPANGVAWLANKLAPFDVALEPGQFVLGGSFTGVVEARAGDKFHVDYGPLGSISCRFVEVPRRMNDIAGSSATMKFGVGQPIRRLEDVRLLTGKGRYQDDQTLPRQTWCVFVRSPHAHARIRSIDTAAAAAAPGVVAVYTGDRLRERRHRACRRRRCRARSATARRCSRRSVPRWSSIARAMSAIRWRW